MKLRTLFALIENIGKQNDINNVYLCGGSVRDRVMNKLDKLEDIDLTTGNQKIKNLAKEIEMALSKKFNITSKQMDDGHESLFLKNIKIDFSSNFIDPSVESYLKSKGIKNPTELQKEMFSRDFNCNALLMDLKLNKIYDPTGKGLNDIKNKIIRTCMSTEITLKSNKNRIIRAIYLAAKLGFSVDPEIITFVANNKELLKDIDNGYMSKMLNKALEHNPNKTVELLDRMNIWQYIPITENLYPLYMKKVKRAQLRRNFDYGEGFYANIDKYKSISDFRKKRKKKRKKEIKKIKDMKLAYYNGINDFPVDNFPIIQNDDLSTTTDRKENKVDENEENDPTELVENGKKKPSLYSSERGVEGLTAVPLIEHAGYIDDESGAVVNNINNPLYNNMGLLNNKEINSYLCMNIDDLLKLSEKFVNITKESIKQPIIFNKHQKGIGPEKDELTDGKISINQAMLHFPRAVHLLINELVMLGFKSKYPGDILKQLNIGFWYTGNEVGSDKLDAYQIDKPDGLVAVNYSPGKNFTNDWHIYSDPIK